MSVNITEVHLLNVPLENDYVNTIWFSDKSLQTNYMKNRIKHSFSNFSYQRKDNVIRVPKHIDELYDCNYVMYKNSAYTDKWFYAFNISLSLI